jgi:hypothetical protein
MYLEKDGVLESHGFVPFDVKSAVAPGKMDYFITEVLDKTSWSCDHQLGRWTGECDCDNPNFKAREDKQHYFQTLKNYGQDLNSRLDAQIGQDWREGFEDFFLSQKDTMFSSGQANLTAENSLFWAKYCELVGRISCGWFFGGEGSPEREIPRTMISEIEKLVPGIREQLVFQSQAA